MSVGSTCPSLTGLTFVKGGPVAIPCSTPERPQVLVLEFWATWCPPCRASVPHLTELQQRYKSKGVTIVGISIDDNVQKVQQFSSQMGSKMDYVVAFDASQGAQRDLYLQSGARGVPHAFIVDASNKIIYSGHPMEPEFAAKLEAAAQCLSQQPQQQQKALPPVTESYEELMTKSIKELKALLSERGIPCGDCLEKGDLAKRIVERCLKVTFYV